MSRSGYTDNYGDDDPLAMGRYRQAVHMAINGKRGQAFLRETLAVLDAMPVKELAAESLVTSKGGYCTLGAVGAVRGLAIEKLDPEDLRAVAATFGIARSMAAEIVFENDDDFFFHREETPAQRHSRMWFWVKGNIKQETP